MGPERRTMIMTDKQKESTAYHEAGHAIVWYLVRACMILYIKCRLFLGGRAFLPEG